MAMPAGYPDVTEVRNYVRVPATQLSDEDLERMMTAAADDQSNRCKWAEADPAVLPAGIEQAFLRRVQREIAARNLPLGMVGLDAAEYGPQSLPGFDSLISEHERPYRRAVVG